jgi:hypothetical protein
MSIEEGYIYSVPIFRDEGIASPKAVSAQERFGLNFLLPRTGSFWK